MITKLCVYLCVLCGENTKESDHVRQSIIRVDPLWETHEGMHFGLREPTPNSHKIHKQRSSIREFVAGKLRQPKET